MSSQQNAGLQPAVRRGHWAVYLLLLLASLHCVRSLFVVNVSLLNLTQYEHGQERMPFQGRVGMIPLMRWAHDSPALAKTAAFLNASLHNTPHLQWTGEEWTPEKALCLLLGCLSVLLLVAAATWFGQQRLGALWWTPPVLLLAMLYVSYAARSEMQFWYPYDLPHFAVFGIACLCLLEGWWLAALALFVVDTSLRETSLFLVPLVLTLGHARGKLKYAALVAAAMVAVWLPVHILISHRFAANPTDARIHWDGITRAIANPLHWPQTASALGFLGLPLLWGRRFLTRDQRWFLIGAAPCLLVTALFGIWYESRIWDEWLLAAAVMLGTELAGRYGPSTAPIALTLTAKLAVPLLPVAGHLQ